MRAKSEADFLNPNFRKQLVEEIEAGENKRRKNKAYRRELIFKDQTEMFVRSAMLKMFSQSTVSAMEISMTNISLARKVIEKLARVYDKGVLRSVEPEDDQVKLDELQDLLKINQHQKDVNKLLKLQRNVLQYIKPCFIRRLQSTGLNLEEMGSWEPVLQELSPWLYDAVEDLNDRTRAIAYILSPFDIEMDELVSLEPEREGRTINTEPSIAKGDAKDQAIADVREDQNRDEDNPLRKPYVVWTDHYHFTMNGKGEIVDKETMMPVTLEGDELFEFIRNPYDEMPFVNYAVGQMSAFWAEGGDDLINASILINTMMTNHNHIAVQQGYGQLLMTGSKLPRTIPTGPDEAILLEYNKDKDPVPTAQYLTASPPLAELREGIESQVALTLTTNNLSTNNVSLKLDGSGSFQSGISKMLDMAESIEDVESQQEIFLDNEPLLWRKINKILQVHEAEGNLSEKFRGLSLSENFNLQIQFPRSAAMMSEKEQLEILEIRKGWLNTDEEIIMRDQPGLSMQEAEEKLIKIAEQKQARMPTMMQNQDSDEKEDQQQEMNLDNEDDQNESEQ